MLAAAGDTLNRSGTNGNFVFTVTPLTVGAPASNSGTIVATAYDATTNEDIKALKDLKAFTQNGVLHVSGLTEGKPWFVYNLYGQLIYIGIADGDKAEIRLPVKGIYFIINEKESIKTICSQ